MKPIYVYSLGRADVIKGNQNHMPPGPALMKLQMPLFW